MKCQYETMRVLLMHLSNENLPLVSYITHIYIVVMYMACIHPFSTQQYGT